MARVRSPSGCGSTPRPRRRRSSRRPRSPVEARARARRKSQGKKAAKGKHRTADAVDASSYGQGPLGTGRPQVAHAGPRGAQRPPRAVGRADSRPHRRPRGARRRRRRLRRPNGPSAEWSGSSRPIARTDLGFPFFHATTSGEWVVTLRFFVPRGTFREGEVEALLDLVPFHESPTPVLSDAPRVKVANVSLGPGDHHHRPRTGRFRDIRLRRVPLQGHLGVRESGQAGQAQEGERTLSGR